MSDKFNHLSIFSFRFFAVLSIVIFAFVIAQPVYAQSDEEVIVRADKLYTSENYAEAMPLYAQLLSLHRGDPFYSYRFGVSMLYSDRSDPDAAIRYIESGLGKLTGNDAILIYFHLGTAYHLTFRFIEAIQYYNIFAEKANPKKFGNYNTKHRIEMCHNGVSLLQNIRDLYVFEKHHVIEDNFFRSYQSSQFGGRLLVKPDIFKTKFDKKSGEYSVVFLSDTQQVAYFSSYGRDGKNGKDIFRSFKKPDGTWGEPERLSKIINTPYDEDYPFILPDGKTLYFCSKGHNSMGGYDVFRTTFNEKSNDWTTPVNLDFAINTPYDEILFVTDKDERFAYFSSVRNSGLNHMNVYKVRIDVRPQEEENDMIAVATDMSADVSTTQYTDAVKMIQEIADLEVNSSQEEYDRVVAENKRKIHEDNYKYNIPENPTSDDIINITFEYAENAERSLLMLRQKRQAAELTTDKYRQQVQDYRAEADRLYVQAAEETDSQRKKELGQQATEMSRKSSEAELMYMNSRNLVSGLNSSIDFQSNEYTSLMFKAGEIQRLASARMIDTSVVLLKQLIDDIGIYDMQVQEIVDTYFPDNETVAQLDEEIIMVQQDISQTEDSIKALSEEKKLFQDELLLIKDPEARKNVNEELVLIDEEIQQLQLRKTELRDSMLSIEDEKRKTIATIESPQYDIISEIETVEEMIINGADSLTVMNTILYNERIEPDTSAVVHHFTDPDTTATHHTIPPDTSSVAIVSPPDTSAVVHHFTDPDTTATHHTITPDTSSVAIVSPPDTTAVVHHFTDPDTTATHHIIPPDTSSVAIVSPPDTTAVVHHFTDPDTTATHHIVSPDTTSVVNIIPPDSTLEYQSNIAINEFITQLPEQKHTFLDEIFLSETSSSEKAQLLTEVFNQEKALLSVKKNQIDALIAETIENIEDLERQISTTDNKLSSSDLSAYDRSLLETQWQQAMVDYKEALQHLDKLLFMESVIQLEILTVNTIIADLEQTTILIEKNQNNSSKANSEFEKLANRIRNLRDDFFRDNTDLQEDIDMNAALLRQESIHYNELSTKSLTLAEEYDQRSIVASQQAENAKSPKKREQFLEQQEKYSNLARTMYDSASFYSEMAIAKQVQATQYSESVPLLTKLSQQISEISSKTVVGELSPIVISEINAETMSRMKQLIAENPWSSNFTSTVSESSQWTHNPVKSDTLRITWNDPIFSTETKNTIPESEQLILQELKIESDKNLAYTIQSSAILHVTRIKQLNEEISATTDPVRTYELFNEVSALQNDLTMLISKYNEIALKTEGMSTMTIETLPQYNELYLIDLKRFASTDAYINLLNDSLNKLQLLSASETNTQKKNEIARMVSQITSEISIAEMNRIEIFTMTQRNTFLMNGVILESVADVIPDASDAEMLTVLQEEIDSIQKQAAKLRIEGYEFSNMDQKKQNTLQLYETEFTLLQKQTQLLTLYEKYLPAETDGNLIALYEIETAINDKQLLTRIFSEQPEITDTRSDTVFETDTTEITYIDTTSVTTSDPTVRDTIPDRRIDPDITGTAPDVVVADRGTPEYISYYNDTTPVPEHTVPAQGLLFRVQFAASKRPAANDAYKGMSPLFYEQSDGWYRYMSGEFYSIAAATTARNTIRGNGFADAFVVAYYNGKRISIAEARNLIATDPNVIASAGDPKIVRTETSEVAEVTTTAARITETEGNTSSVAFASLEGFFYAVQIGVYGKPRTSAQLFGIDPLIEDRMENGYYRYLTGTFTSLAEANTARDAARAKGINDAFVVVYRNGKRISVRDAEAYITSGEQPKSVVIPSTQPIETTIPAINYARAANIGFRVQLGAYRNEVPVEVVNAFIAIAREGIQIIKSPDGLTIYTAGSYQTIEEAEAMKLRIQQGGIEDAFIIAVEGDQKISIQEAKQLLRIE